MTDEQTNDLQPISKVGPLPLFWGADNDTLERIESQGHNDYYVISLEKITVTSADGKSTKIEHRPGVFRVTKTLIGRAITATDGKELDLYCVTGVSANYDMPRIPWEMKEKMDAFFRAAHKKHGTEAILVLTYDTTFFDSTNPSAGWNCIAPDQENTAGDCKYDPPSVLKYKKEDEIIVGTIHSHPEMSAFFSGTDHKDQDDWDGIHITQAWKGNGPTEYYIALILGGKEWVLTESQVFGSAPLPTVDTTEVEGWLENVSKKVYPQASSHNSHYMAQSVGGTPGTFKNVRVPLPSQGLMPSDKVRAIRLPADAPDPRQNVIVPEYSQDILLAPAGTHNCRLCNSPLLPAQLDGRRCIACYGFILIEGETVQDVVDLRNAGQFPYVLEIDPERTTYSIQIWKLDGSFEVVHVSEEAAANPK